MAIGSAAHGFWFPALPRQTACQLPALANFSRNVAHSNQQHGLLLESGCLFHESPGTAGAAEQATVAGRVSIEGFVG